MGYLGTPPQSGFITTSKQRVTSSTNNYVDLDHAISSIADVIVFVNFVKQDTTNLTLTTSTRITLGGTLVSSDIVEIHYLGKAVNTQTPATGTVTADALAGSIGLDKLSATGTKSSSTFLRGDNTFAEAGGGELVFIDKNISTSGGTYATMDNVFSSTYQNYVAFIGLSTSVENDVFFNYRVGDAGSTSLSEDASYKYAGRTAKSGAADATSNYGNNGDKVQFTHGSNANDNRLSAVTATMYFYTPYSTSFMARSTYTYFYQNSSAEVRGGAGGMLYGYLTAPKTGFSFYTSGGTIDEINIRVYGIKDN